MANMKPFEDGSIIVELVIHNIAMIVAFIVLIIEKIVHKKVHTQGSGRFWRFIQTLIDSERYFFLNKVNIHLKWCKCLGIFFSILLNNWFMEQKSMQ